MSNEHILIVEDEVFIGLGIQEKLESFGYFVDGIAASGKEALELVLQHQPDLVVMDIVIKGEMDGIETTQRIRDQFDIPVIYLTAFGDDHHLRRAKVTDPSGYLLKPFSDRELQITIDIALYKHHLRKKLKNQQRWYSTILKSLGDAVVTLDTTHHVTFMNPSAEALFGVQSHQKRGFPIQDVILTYSQASTRIMERLQESTTTSETLRVLGVLFKIEENELILNLCIAPIYNEDSQLMGISLVFSDQTEQRQYQQLIEQQSDSEAEVEDPVSKLLTYREKQILAKIVDGQTTKEIASDFEISPRTVEFHRYNLMRKLNVQDIPSLVRESLSKKLVPFSR